MTIINLHHNEFKQSLKELKPFMSTEETRYYLMGINFRIEGNKITIAATNGHILCEKTLINLSVASGDKEQEACSFIMPSKAVSDLLKILPADKDAFINITYSEQRIEFDTFYFQYRCREVDGTFPNYEKVIPETKDTLSLPAARAEYVTSALNALGKNAAVDIGYKDESSPFILTAEGNEEMKCVVMPIRVSLETDNKPTTKEK